MKMVTAKEITDPNKRLSGTKMARFVVCYDISDDDDDTRHWLSKVLKDDFDAVAVQESVYFVEKVANAESLKESIVKNLKRRMKEINPNWERPEVFSIMAIQFSRRPAFTELKKESCELDT